MCLLLAALIDNSFNVWKDCPLKMRDLVETYKVTNPEHCVSFDVALKTVIEVGSSVEADCAAKFVK